MDQLLIVPGEAIGTIKLGMHKAEVEECIQAYVAKYQKKYHSRNYMKNSFMVEYDGNEQVIFIQIPSGLKDDFECVLNGIDLFNTKAEELVERIDKISNYDRNHWELGYTYAFPEIGLTFWRPNVLKEEDLQAEWFQEMAPDIQEDEKKYLFFETVSIERDDYRKNT